MQLFDSSGAEISSCNKYRYRLWRAWDQSMPICNYIMLNPSTADAINNDHTITRCINRAKVLGFGGITVCNLFAYRTAYPRELKIATNPIGSENNRHLFDCAKRANITICAWGNDGDFLDRESLVIKMLKENNIKLYHLGLSKSGKPLHPSARGKVRCIDYTHTQHSKNRR